MLEIRDARHLSGSDPTRPNKPHIRTGIGRASPQ
jgi:hypothetical protein